MSQVMPEISQAAMAVLRALESGGAEAWVVGGWVRDALAGGPSHDVDVTTSARWQDAASMLARAGIAVHETGTKHGTITAVVDGVPVEVTTYRVEAGYADHRHPDEVRFVDDVREDLARRDLTINAIAYHPERGLLDPFGGADDLAAGVIRAVGEPDVRFEEDALRVLRAVRFACRMGFSIEPTTQRALEEHAPELDEIASERIGSELDGILATGRMGWALREQKAVLCQAIPELSPCVGFDQRSKYHHLDVLDHIAGVLDAVEAFSGGMASQRLRWAALMHDIAKPRCFTVDDGGRGHFYGHPEEGERMAEQIMRRLALPLALIRPVRALVRLHDRPLRGIHEGDRAMAERSVRRMLARMEELCEGEGPALAHELIVLKQADALAHAAPYRGWAAELEEARRIIRGLVAEQGAFSVRDLAISGQDVMDALGIEPGPRVGEVLRELLGDVIEGKLPNKRDALLAHICK